MPKSVRTFVLCSHRFVRVSSRLCRGLVDSLQFVFSCLWYGKSNFNASCVGRCYKRWTTLSSSLHVTTMQHPTVSRSDVMRIFVTEFCGAVDCTVSAWGSF